jgi:transposase
MTAKSVRTIDATQLPEDPSQLKSMVMDLAALVIDLDDQKEYLLQKLYGKKSERVIVDPNQLTLGFIDGAATLDSLGSAAADVSTLPAPSSDLTLGRRKGHGRRPIPPSIPREKIESALSEAERMCPDCHVPAEKIGEEVSEQLEYRPAIFVVKQFVRNRYGCRCCRKYVITAPLPEKPIEKGLAGPGLLAHVATAKYADHLPLYRLETIFERAGLEISRSTLSDWVAAVADALEPIVVEISEDILRGKLINADDTKLPVLEGVKAGKTREGRIWVFNGDEEHPHVYFLYTENRSRDGPVQYLKRFEGFLQADADKRLDKLFLPEGKIIEVGCWAHARRGFFEARTSDPVRSLATLELIKKLYKIEERGQAVDSATRKALREAESKLILTKIEEFIASDQVKVLPKSPIGKAFQYARNQWKALNRYVEDGDLAIDNNVAERMLRHVVKGRDNWTFAGSDSGGRRAAILYSIVMTCKRNGVDPFVYIRDVIMRVSTHPARLVRDLLPDRWKTLRERDAAKG